MFHVPTEHPSWTGSLWLSHLTTTFALKKPKLGNSPICDTMGKCEVTYFSLEWPTPWCLLGWKQCPGPWHSLQTTIRCFIPKATPPHTRYCFGILQFCAVKSQQTWNHYAITLLHFHKSFVFNPYSFLCLVGLLLLFCFETRRLKSRTTLNSMLPRMTLKSWSSCLYFSSTGVTEV